VYGICQILLIVIYSMISNDLAIFDELCKRSLMFIDKCFFHNSNLIKFIVRYGVLFGRYKSVIGSNFHFHSLGADRFVVIFDRCALYLILTAGRRHVQQRLLDWILHRLHGNPSAHRLPHDSSARNVFPGIHVCQCARNGSHLQSPLLCHHLSPSNLIPTTVSSCTRRIHSLAL